MPRRKGFIARSTIVLRIKSQVRARDGFKCIKCGMTNAESKEQSGRQLDVHRFSPGSEYTLDGCATYCRKCHPMGVRRSRFERDQERATSPVRMRANLIAQLKTIRAMSREMGENFDPQAFLVSVISQPVEELHAKTLAAFAEWRKAR